MKKKLTRRSIIKKSVIWDDVISMIRHSLPRFLFMGVIIGFLLFFLNLLLGISNHASSFSDTLQSKLGMYFYIKDLPGESNNVSTRVLHLQQALEKESVKTDFVSKDDAKQFLSNRIPDILEQFEYYGIESPFPATLYVMIRSQEDYDAVATVLPEYNDIILNVSDLTKGRTIQEQEKRIVRVMNLTNGIKIFSYLLIIFFLIIVAVIMFYMMHAKFLQFHDKIELKKMLGASYTQIKLPFLISSTILLGIGFVVMIFLLFGANTYLGQFDLSLQYFAQMFNLDIELSDALVKDYIGTGTLVILAEILIFTALLWGCASMYLNGLIKRVDK